MNKEDTFSKHNFYYIVEMIILVLGFFLIYLLSYDITLQFSVLIFVLLAYMVMGFIHHKTSHTFSTKIVIEYVLVSSLILAGFLFLNIARIP